MNKLPLLRSKPTDPGETFEVFFSPEGDTAVHKVTLNALHLAQVDKVPFGQLHLWVAIFHTSLPVEEPPAAPPPPRNARPRKRSATRP